MRKIITKLLVLIFVFSSTTVSFAGTNATDEFSITQLGSNKILLAENDETSIISIVEEEKMLKVQIFDASTELEEKGYFIVDKENGNMYSSFTGNNVNIKNVILENNFLRSNGVSTWARTVQTTLLVKVSYAKLYSLCGDGATLSTVAGAILVMISYAGVGGAAITAAGIATALASIGLSKIQTGIKSKATNKGIALYLLKQEITKHQGGRIVTGYRYTLDASEYTD